MRGDSSASHNIRAGRLRSAIKLRHCRYRGPRAPRSHFLDDTRESGVNEPTMAFVRATRVHTHTHTHTHKYFNAPPAA